MRGKRFFPPFSEYLGRWHLTRKYLKKYDTDMLPVYIKPKRTRPMPIMDKQKHNKTLSRLVTNKIKFPSLWAFFLLSLAFKSSTVDYFWKYLINLWTEWVTNTHITYISILVYVTTTLKRYKNSRNSRKSMRIPDTSKIHSFSRLLQTFTEFYRKFIQTLKYVATLLDLLIKKD